MAESGWTSFFRRKDIAGNDFFGTFLNALARIFEGAEEEDTLRQIRSELVRAFDCEDISLFIDDPEVKPDSLEGDWVLSVKSGFGEGNRVCQRDARELPDLEPGVTITGDEQKAQKAALKAIALAFEQDTFYGCDIENKKIVLLENPKPEDDLGSGDLSVLAIPLRYHHRVGTVTERTRVGVLALFKTPVRRELQQIETNLRSLLAYATITPRCQTIDPVSGLYTERHIKQELTRQLGLFNMTKGKLRGGLVVGRVDTLKMYKQTLEAEGRVDPAMVGQKVSEVFRGIGQCAWKRASNHALDQAETYVSGYAGRLGEEGFAVILPLLQPHELCMWAVRLSKDILSHYFEGEDLLLAGDVTVSQRVIPFARGTLDELWGLAERALERVHEEQLRARREPTELAKVVNTIRIFSRGKWLTTSEFVSSVDRL